MGLVSAFRSTVSRILEQNPELRHRMVDEQSTARLDFPKADASGFDVVIQVWDDHVHIGTDRGWHEDEFDVSEQRLSALMGFVRDMLSPGMRLRERRAAGLPYRWQLETYDGVEWQNEGTTGLLFWIYIGWRSEHIFQNRHLPSRALRSDATEL